MPPPQNIDQDTVDQVRLNTAFEEMMLAVLAGAGVGAVLAFAINLPVFFTAGFSVQALLSAGFAAFLSGFLIFLTGLVASVALGAPLFSYLEKRKRRSVWPYLAAALGVAVVALVLAGAVLSASRAAGPGMIAVVVAPAIVMALTFARRMRPHWRAAEKAEADAARGPIYIRLH